MNIYNNHLFMNLRGSSDHICLNTGRGHFAYLSSGDGFVSELFKSICIWSRPANTYITKDGYYYSQFELDCRDKKFFKSISFKKICEKHGIKLTIFDDETDNNTIIEFWKQMK